MISVLVVDDEAPFLELCKWYLEQTNEFTVTTASSAPEALHLLQSNGVQAIVSDYQMPGMDGIAFLKQVRATHKHIPFIIFTGKGWESIAVEAFENGADFYLNKDSAEPAKATYASLMHKIKTAVEHRRADAEVITLNRLYSVLSATNKAIVHIHNKTELLNEVCRIVVDTGGFTMAWAGIANPQTHLIEIVGASGKVEGYLDTIAISTDDTSRGRGPTGTAFRTRSFIICNDIKHDPRMAPWREEALKRGYRSLAAFPFAPDTKNAGVITFYAPEPGFFTDSIIRLLEEQSVDISFALRTFDHEEQRIAAEQDLKKSELQYRRLFETAQDAILILDGETGKVIDANRFILDMLAYPLEYFIGKHLWELGFISDKSLAKQAFAELKTNGYVRYEDLPLARKDGVRIDVEFISNSYSVGDKKIIQCNIRDISDRKRAEEKEKVHFAKYKAIFESVPLGITISDKGGNIVESNRMAENLLGFAIKDSVGRTIDGREWKIIRPDGSPMPADEYASVRALKENRIIANVEMGLVKEEGQITWINVTAAPIPLEGYGVVIAYSDITEHLRAESALRESEGRYRSLFNTIEEGFCIIEVIFDENNKPVDYRFIEVNPAFEKQTGLIGAKGRRIREFAPPHEDYWFEIYGKIALTGEPAHFEHNASQLHRWYTVYAFRFGSPEKRLVSVIFNDITNIKTAENALRTFSANLEREVAERTATLSDVNLKLMAEIRIRIDAEKHLNQSVSEKEVLLREVHHRVKNNLQIIISLLNLQSRFITDEKMLAAFRESQSRVRVMALVHEKLYQSADLATINLEDYLRFLGNNLLQVLGMKGKGIELTMDIQNISLAIDTAIPLGLMINELISNSLKYAFPDGRKGEVSLTIHREDHTLTIQFKDNGVGIPEDLDWRNSKSLGLRLVISLVEQLDGTIELDRSSGTVFTIVVKEKV